MSYLPSLVLVAICGYFISFTAAAHSPDMSQYLLDWAANDPKYKIAIKKAEQLGVEGSNYLSRDEEIDVPMLDEFTYKSDGSFDLPSDIGTKIMQQFSQLTADTQKQLLADLQKAADSISKSKPGKRKRALSKRIKRFNKRRQTDVRRHH